jgi:hypothetical protein
MNFDIQWMRTLQAKRSLNRAGLKKGLLNFQLEISFLVGRS